MTMTESEITIRDAAETDIPAIQAIYSHYVLHGLASFEIERTYLAEMTRRFPLLVTAAIPF